MRDRQRPRLGVVRASGVGARETDIEDELARKWGMQTGQGAQPVLDVPVSVRQ
jgi:hypothetical protein